MKLGSFTISPIDLEKRKVFSGRSGDTVKVTVKIKEGDKVRGQVFEGVVVSRKHGTEPGATFTVRKVIDGVGVEKIFPLYSPVIEKIEIKKSSGSRKSKLYYMRRKAAKEISRKLKSSVVKEIAEAEAKTESPKG